MPRQRTEAGIIIAEVGAWSNPMSTDPEEARAALAKCQTQLALAEEIGARCCVNISGSRESPGTARIRITYPQKRLIRSWK